MFLLQDCDDRSIVRMRVYGNHTAILPSRILPDSRITLFQNAIEGIIVHVTLRTNDVLNRRREVASKP